MDLVAELDKPATKEEINAAMKAAAEGPMKGILEYTDDPIVSMDVVGNPASSVFDGKSTMVMPGGGIVGEIANAVTPGSGTFIKVLSWYDNEWGYSSRLADLITKVMAQVP